MSAVGWIENRLATSRIDGAVIRLCEPQGRRFAGQAHGCEATHQVGLWTSEAHRPRGEYRFGASGAFVPIGRVSFVPADVEWEARFEDCGPVRPALYCDFEKDYFRELTGLGGADGAVPLDRWFGTWHDGTKGGDAVMQARFEQKKARMNAGTRQAEAGPR